MQRYTSAEMKTDFDMGNIFCIIAIKWLNRAGVLVLAVLEYWISDTRTLLVLVSSKVIILVRVLVLGDKYSGTRTSTGLSTDILWYICDIRMKPSAVK